MRSERTLYCRCHPTGPIYARIASIHLDQFCSDLQRCIGRTVGTFPRCSSWTLGAFSPEGREALNALGPLRADWAAKADGVTDPSTIIDDYAYTLNSNVLGAVTTYIVCNIGHHGGGNLAGLMACSSPSPMVIPTKTFAR